MIEAVDIVKQFNPVQTIDVARAIQAKKKILLTGEGSSRIFPAKNVIRKSHQWGVDLNIITENSHQAASYDLYDFVVFCSSNSGRTKEVLSLVKKITGMGHEHCYALTAHTDTPLEKYCTETFVLHCGEEEAVAATKSVIAQALFYESILWNMQNRRRYIIESSLSVKILHTLTMPVQGQIVAAAAAAPTIYFAGFNDGVAEELTLKTNEITRKKSDFLEGTYAVHGIEEVLEKDDIVFVIDPIEEEIEKFQKVLVEGVGMKVIAIATKPTPFQTIRVPDAGFMNPYLFLCAGWNVLVEIGLSLGINLDKPTRARKIGNECVS